MLLEVVGEKLVSKTGPKSASTGVFFSEEIFPKKSTEFFSENFYVIQVWKLTATASNLLCSS